jgi:hypothetical protein
MPIIVTSKNPPLRAAKINIQLELLAEQASVNPDQADLKKQINRMLEVPRFDIKSPIKV